MVPRKVFAEGSTEGFCGRFRGRFLRKVPRKVIPEGKQILQKVLAKGFCGRLRGRFFLFLVEINLFYCRGFRGRFLRKAPRKVFAEGFNSMILRSTIGLIPQR